MTVSMMKWSSGGIGNAISGSAKYDIAVKMTRASSRDITYFSAQARTAAKEAAEAVQAVVDEAVDKVEESVSAETGEEKKTLSDIIKEQTDKIDSMFSSNKKDKANDTQLLLIKQKMRGGYTLSANEEKYLSQNDPDSYKNYRVVLDARRMFRCQLASCRTKDDVNGMRLSNALSALSAYKKAIRQGGDGAEVAGLNMALEREIQSYAKTARYQNLPTAAERGKYEMELSKARKYEREKRIADRINAKSKKKKQIKFPGDGKRTVAQVENSYLGRKIRKADRGASCGGCCSSSFGSSYRKLDLLG